MSQFSEETTMSTKEDYVVKRNGERQNVDLNKITHRLLVLKKDVEKILRKVRPGFTYLNVNVTTIAKKTIGQMYNGITTSEMDIFAADISAYITDHPDYAVFAGSIIASNLEANNKDYLGFAAYAKYAYNYFDIETEKVCPLISEELYDISQKYGHIIDKKMDLSRNNMYDYFAIQTLIKGKYLLGSYRTVQINRVETQTLVPFETPQHMWMRVALGINGNNFEEAFELYDAMSLHKATHATPTIFNAGTNRPQMSSCFLLDMKDDSIEGIYDTLKNCALISKSAGGIGLSSNKIRSSGSYIASTHGTSNGIVPMLKVFNSTARYCDQGGGKRKGSFAIYLSPYHADLLEWLELKKNTGAEESRSRDLFYALWISDLFMKRVKEEFDRDPDITEPVLWSFFDPNIAKGFDEIWGEEFERAYLDLEQKGKFVKQMPVRDVWYKIMESQIEAGTPYILFKDHCNRKTNQKNLGTIKSSNLCAEIIEYTSKDEIAVCNLASISLPAFVKNVDSKQDKFEYDYKGLYETCRLMVRNLDRVIDRNSYPVKEAETSNMNHRPVGMGVQGLARVFCHMRVPFDSDEAMLINKKIFETIYFAAVTESHSLAVEKGAYPSIDRGVGAPIKRGVFQQDLWVEHNTVHDTDLAWDWEGLREKVRKDGVRNSLLVALMPTASTSQILGNTESFEPYYSNMFARKTKVGEFFMVNPYLVTDLEQLGLWKTHIDPVTKQEYNPIKDKIINNQGSVQGIEEIPKNIQNIYRTLMDIPLRKLTLMARDRAVYVDQSMSLNVYHRNGDNMMVKMTQYLVYAWKLGLKTGSYYTRTIQDIDTINFAGVSKLKNKEKENNEGGDPTVLSGLVCTEDVCTMCSA